MAIHKQMKVVEQRLDYMKVTRDMFQRALKISSNTYTNWKTRGISSRNIVEVAQFIRCDPIALKKGLYKPLTALNKGFDPDQYSQEAQDIAMSYDLLPESLQRHINLMVNDYVASAVPILKTLYNNASISDQKRFNRLIEIAQEKDKKDKA